MSVDVETIVAVSIMMAVFSAVAAVGTSIVLGAGFERLRNSFEIVRKQSGFFSDAIHKLEEKMEVVDENTGRFSQSISLLDRKVANVGEQTNSFTDKVKHLENKVDIVDRQTSFFSNSLYDLEQKMTNDGWGDDSTQEEVSSEVNECDYAPVGSINVSASEQEHERLSEYQVTDLNEKLLYSNISQHADGHSPFGQLN